MILMGPFQLSLCFYEKCAYKIHSGLHFSKIHTYKIYIYTIYTHYICMLCVYIQLIGYVFIK